MSQYDPAICWEENAETWTCQARAGYDIYRDAVNTPAFLAMLPPVAGMDGLDVGCGEGGNTRRLAKLGARMSAIDISPTFIRYAGEAELSEPLGIAYRVGDAQALPYTNASFDFVTAFMSLMDVADPSKALAEISRVLRPGGFVQFSIIHPCFAPPHRKVLRDAEGLAYAIEIAEYFSVGQHVESWWFTKTSAEERATVKPFRVPYFHMPLSMWVERICQAGLVIQQLGEPSASDEVARTVPDVADTQIAPLFLHIRAMKAGNTGDTH